MIDLVVFLFAEDFSRLWLLNRRRDQRPLYFMWTYKLLMQNSEVFYHVYCSEALKLDLIHLLH